MSCQQEADCHCLFYCRKVVVFQEIRSNFRSTSMHLFQCHHQSVSAVYSLIHNADNFISNRCADQNGNDRNGCVIYLFIYFSRVACCSCKSRLVQVGNQVEVLYTECLHFILIIYIFVQYKRNFKDWLKTEDWTHGKGRCTSWVLAMVCAPHDLC